MYKMWNLYFGGDLILDEGRGTESVVFFEDFYNL